MGRTCALSPGRPEDEGFGEIVGTRVGGGEELAVAEGLGAREGVELEGLRGGEGVGDKEEVGGGDAVGDGKDVGVGDDVEDVGEGEGEVVGEGEGEVVGEGEGVGDGEGVGVGQAGTMSCQA
jgi:hypothetical protein